MAASLSDVNDVAFGAFMHDMKYSILLHPYSSLYRLYTYTRETQWANQVANF